MTLILSMSEHHPDEDSTLSATTISAMPEYRDEVDACADVCREHPGAVLYTSIVGGLGWVWWDYL